MNVLWISPGFAADENDSTCIPSLQLLALALKTKEINLDILTIGFPFTSTAYTWNTISVKSGYGANGKWLRWLNWIRVYQYGLKLHKEKNYDIIHSFWLGPAWLVGKWLSKKCQLPHITTLMGQDALKSNKYSILLTATDMTNIVAVSSFQANECYKAHKQRPAKIIEWGIHPDELIINSNTERNIDIIGCGSLIKLKNWNLWVETVSGIIDQNKSIKAIIIGDGPEKSKIHNLILSLGKQDNIKILEPKPRKEVLNLMSQAKILLHTASYESYGFVLLEAYAMGCKIVSTPVGIAEKLGRTGATKEELKLQLLKSLEMNLIKPVSAAPTIFDTADQYFDLYCNTIDLFKNKPIH